MSFFDRNRKELEKRGIDSARLPPGQYFTDRFPVLHAGSVPEYPDLSDWAMVIGGLVSEPKTLSFADVLERVEVDAAATHLMCQSEYGFTSNLPLADCMGVDAKGQPRAMLAYE